MKFHKDRTNNEKLTPYGIWSYKVNSLCLKAVTHPFTHQSQRGLTSLESEFERKGECDRCHCSMAYADFEFLHDSRSFPYLGIPPNIPCPPPTYSLSPPHIPCPPQVHVFREKLRDVREF